MLPCEAATNDTAVLLAICGTLAGVVITQGINIVLKKMEYSQALNLKKIDTHSEIKMKYIFEPIISFLDSDLKYMQMAYSKSFIDSETSLDLSINKQHIFDLSIIESRIKSLQNSDLTYKFSKFSTKRIAIGTELEDGLNNKAYQELKSAIELAGEVFEILFTELNKTEN